MQVRPVQTAPGLLEGPSLEGRYLCHCFCLHFFTGFETSLPRPPLCCKDGGLRTLPCQAAAGSMRQLHAVPCAMVAAADCHDQASYDCILAGGWWEWQVHGTLLSMK